MKTLTLLLFFGTFSWIFAQGPGFPNVQRRQGELLADFVTNETVPRVRTVAIAYIDGYVLTDTRSQNRVKQVWDIQDPTQPKEVSRVSTPGMMHTSAMALPNHYINNRNNYFNISDMENIRREDPSGYNLIDAGSRSANILPYQYSSNQIHDARRPRRDTLISELTDHDFFGQVIPIGNLMLVTGIRGQDTRALAIYDISNPATPFLLDRTGPNFWEQNAPAYESAVWRHFVVLSTPANENNPDIVFVDFSDPSELRFAGKIQEAPGAARYPQFQDDIMFVGQGKYDLSPLLDENPGDPILLSTFEHDGEYALPLGNLLICAENSGQRGDNSFNARIFAHQGAPDTRRPSVGYHNPVAGETEVAVTSRIGLVIHETLNYATINAANFFVVPADGGERVSGTYTATDKDVITFTPDEQLEFGTTYRVQVISRGIKDVSGNGIRPLQFFFTTEELLELPIEVASFESSTYPVSIGGSTQFSATATGGNGEYQYRWDFGDGNNTEWGSASSVTHTYANVDAGHYEASVRVRRAAGGLNVATRFMTVAVLDPPPSSQAIKSSQIIKEQGQNRIWCVNPDNNTITMINSLTFNKMREKPVSKDPRSIAQDGRTNLWIACMDADCIDIHTRTGRFIDRIHFASGAGPKEMVIIRSENTAYVTLAGSGEIAKVNTESRKIESIVPAVETASALALSADAERLYVNRFISPDSGGEVRVFDTKNGSLDYASTIVLEEDITTEDSGLAGKGLPNYLSDIAIGIKGDYAYVTSKKDNIRRGIFEDDGFADDPSVSWDDARDGNPLTHETTCRAIVSKIDLKTGKVVNEIDFDDSSQPTALHLSPYGDYLFVALQGNNEVRVVDTFNDTVVETIACGHAPQGLYFDASTYRLYVKSLTDRSVTIHDLTNRLQNGGATPSRFITRKTVRNEIFDAEVLLGKKIFYNAADERMSLQGYMSCALCHQDGGHDGRTWDFTGRGEGLRNTTTLNGKSGLGHGNVHWSGNFNEIQDFELDMVGPFGGTGFLPEGESPNTSLGADNGGRSAELDALAAYVNSLGIESVSKSPHREANGSLTSNAERGRELFYGAFLPAAGTALNCASCHVPTNGYTNSLPENLLGLTNVGTIGRGSGKRLTGALNGIDTPTLISLHDSAPYFHNGSAATLEEVFLDNGSGAAVGNDASAHNLTETGYDLTPSEKEYLFAYLRQLDQSSLLEQRSNQEDGFPWNVEDRIQAEDFDIGGENISYHDESVKTGDLTLRPDTEVDLESTNNGTIVSLVGTAAGEWLEYTVVVHAAGAYDLDLRVASRNGGYLRASINGGTYDSPELITGGSNIWRRKTIPGIVLSEGVHVLRLDITDGGFNLDWFQFRQVTQPTFANGGDAWLVGQRIEAEDYDTGGAGVSFSDSDSAKRGGDSLAKAYRPGDAVDLASVTDGGGGFYVGWITQGEWLEYTIQVHTASTYHLVLRVAGRAGNNATGLEVIINGEVRATSPNLRTGGNDIWRTRTVRGLELSPGIHKLRLRASTSGFNLNWLQLVEDPNAVSEPESEQILVTGPEWDEPVSDWLGANLGMTTAQPTPSTRVIDNISYFVGNFDSISDRSSIVYEISPDLVNWEPVDLSPFWIFEEDGAGTFIIPKEVGLESMYYQRVRYDDNSQ